MVLFCRVRVLGLVLSAVDEAHGLIERLGAGRYLANSAVRALPEATRVGDGGRERNEQQNSRYCRSFNTLLWLDKHGDCSNVFSPICRLT